MASLCEESVKDRGGSRGNTTASTGEGLCPDEKDQSKHHERQRPREELGPKGPPNLIGRRLIDEYRDVVSWSDGAEKWRMGCSRLFGTRSVPEFESKDCRARRARWASVVIRLSNGGVNAFGAGEKKGQVSQKGQSPHCQTSTDEENEASHATLTSIVIARAVKSASWSRSIPRHPGEQPRSPFSRRVLPRRVDSSG